MQRTRWPSWGNPRPEETQDTGNSQERNEKKTITPTSPLYNEAGFKIQEIGTQTNFRESINDMLVDITVDVNNLKQFYKNGEAFNTELLNQVTACYIDTSLVSTWNQKLPKKFTLEGKSEIVHIPGLRKVVKALNIIRIVISIGVNITILLDNKDIKS